MNTTAQNPTSPAVIHLFCLCCGHRLWAAASMAGRRTTCPVCEAALRVPSGFSTRDPKGDLPTLPDTTALTSSG